MKIRMVIALILFTSLSFAQKEDRNWVFGHRCGIDFNDLNNPQPFKSNAITSDEIAASISNKNSGDLLIYLSPFRQVDIKIRNGFHQIITGGENIGTFTSFAHGAVILPKPNTDNMFYIFHSNFLPINLCTASAENYCNGLFYSEVDMSMNSDSGQVTIINEVLGDFSSEEGISCVKHANGIDWWLLVHQAPDSNNPCSNTIHKYLISKDGINATQPQNIGTPKCRGRINYNYPDGRIEFSKNGNKVVKFSFVNGIVDVFDFNRFTGELFNYQNIINDSLSIPYGCEFSPNEKYLYISHWSSLEIGPPPYSKIDYLYQYDLNNNFSRKLIWSDSLSTSPDFKIGQLQLAPNNKIYLPYSSFSLDNNGPFNHYNNNLSFINQPDSFGVACDFRPFAFNLGDSSYASHGLPNMPNYNLGVLDTNVGIEINNINLVKLNIYPNPTSKILHIETVSQNHKVKNIQIIDINGRSVIHAKQSPINTSELSQGIYFYQVEMNSGELVRGKFVKQ